MKWLLIVILITGCAMRFEDVEIGGIENGPVNIKTVGDKDKAAQYIRHARVVLGNLKQYMQLNEYTSLQTEVKLADGTKIRAMSNTNGLTDIDKVFIDVPTTVSVEEGAHNCYGYILQSYRDDNPDNIILYFQIVYSEDDYFLPYGDNINEQVTFDNYPDFGAKYVNIPTSGGNPSEVDEIYLATKKYDYDENPVQAQQYSYIGPTGTSLPTPAAGWAWAYSAAVNLVIWDAVNYIWVDTGVTRSFLRMTGDNSITPAPWYGYPGSQGQFGIDYSNFSTEDLNNSALPAVNSFLQAHHNRFDPNLSVHEYFYQGLNKFNWIRKHFEDYGFAAATGIYKTNKTDKYFNLTEMKEVQNGITYNGLMYMVPSNPALKLTDKVIENNLFDSYESEQVSQSPGTTGDWFEGSAPEPGLPFDNPVTPPDFMPEGVTYIPSGVAACRVGIDDYCTTPYIYEWTLTDHQEATSDLFNINCKVKKGKHKIGIRSTGSINESKILVTLYTDMGLIKFIVDDLVFSNNDANKRIEIIIGEFNKIEEVFNVIKK